MSFFISERIKKKSEIIIEKNIVARKVWTFEIGFTTHEFSWCSLSVLACRGWFVQTGWYLFGWSKMECSRLLDLISERGKENWRGLFKYAVVRLNQPPCVTCNINCV